MSPAITTQRQTAPDTPLKDVDVVIIGTGFAGLGMGVRLKRHGRESFVILERAHDVGGTWRDNTYPGAACDIPSHLYSFSFRPNPEWSRLFSPGPEILEYLRDTAREEGLLPHIRFGADVKDARWDADKQRWTVTTADGVFTGRFLVTGTGHLADESLPPIKGLDGFTGETFHSARWNHRVPLDGKRIGVVGSGATAIQLVPELAKTASELVVFQRSAPYVTPRPDRVYTETQKQLFRRDPDAIPAHRAEIFWFLEDSYAQRRAVPEQLAQVKAAAREHLQRQVEDEELRAKLTPDYEPGCKRILISDTFYPALARDNVTLEASALDHLDGDKAISADGNAYELDVLVFCTGFEAAEPPYAALVHDGEGVSLADRWVQGMEAFASTTVSGFPNLFIVNGPNTGLGHNSIVYVIEAQIDYILGALDWSEANGNRVLDVSAEAQARYVEELQERSKGTVWLSDGCKSWYIDPHSGRLTLIWPEFAHEFRHRNGSFDPAPYIASESVATA
ncbi:NAD(P)/FAD-dependent oxidoreductase (plasmid) [Streptomyces sp. WAC00288]|uniref:flavin-containing monooxygenase n=1 Tax=unclassified Streptomyces TaxID=2593676 RepID=UPI00099F51DD|nr:MULTISPECIES: NAD(P)/FAD-dependent oxidoreductase [unclassified Streptomyces]AVI00221.1 NAD(P)/FAD-dependent oxidoreductase [Streptomyces sp. WAC00288]